MIFKIYTTRSDYRREWIKPLVDLGFIFESKGDWKDRSNFNGAGEVLFIVQPINIEINSIEELIELQKKVGDIIIHENHEIEIYNDHHS